MLIQRMARQLFSPEEDVKFYKISTEIEYDAGRHHEEHIYKYFKSKEAAKLFAEGFSLGVATALGGNETKTTFSALGSND